MVGVKLCESLLIQFGERRSALLQPTAEIRYQRTLGLYRGRGVILACEELRKSIDVSSDWVNAHGVD
jgi:hypothetical protein